VVKLCGDKDVLFGLIDIGSRRAEDPAALAARVREALRYTTPERLLLAPDCGLVLLDRSLARAKLRALSEAARLARREVGLSDGILEDDVR
jgi:5-methyltetrahydropteroyltriglutamate--homocysteine methyltransferase